MHECEIFFRRKSIFWLFIIKLYNNNIYEEKKSRKGSIYEIEIIKLSKNGQISITQIVWTRDFISFFFCEIN